LPTTLSSIISEINASTSDEQMLAIENFALLQKSVLQDMRTRLLYSQDSNMAETMNQLDYVRTKASDGQLDLLDYTDNAKSANTIRYPITFVLLFIPFASLVIGLVAGLCEGLKHHTPKLFSFNWHLMYGCMLLLMIAFAVHVPFAAVTGDSCSFLNAAEGTPETKLHITHQAALIILSCLADTPGASIVAATNLTDVLAFASLTFNPQPLGIDLTQFTYPTLTSLSQQVSTLQPWTFSNYNQTVNETDADLINFNNYTSPQVYNRSNVLSVNISTYPASQQSAMQTIQDRLNVSIGAENAVLAFLALVSSKTTAASQFAVNFDQDVSTSMSTIFARTSVDSSIQNQLSNLIGAGQLIIDNGNCGSIGETYFAFKSAWCDVIATSFSMLVLAFFVVSMLAIPVVGISMVLMTRMDPSHHPDNKNMQMEDYSKHATRRHSRMPSGVVAAPATRKQSTAPVPSDRRQSQAPRRASHVPAHNRQVSSIPSPSRSDVQSPHPQGRRASHIPGQSGQSSQARRASHVPDQSAQSSQSRRGSHVPDPGSQSRRASHVPDPANQPRRPSYADESQPRRPSYADASQPRRASYSESRQASQQSFSANVGSELHPAQSGRSDFVPRDHSGQSSLLDDGYMPSEMSQVRGPSDYSQSDFVPSERRASHDSAAPAAQGRRASHENDIEGGDNLESSLRRNFGV
jgi:hypothetical protein